MPAWGLTTSLTTAQFPAVNLSQTLELGSDMGCDQLGYDSGLGLKASTPTGAARCCRAESTGACLKHSTTKAAQPTVCNTLQAAPIPVSACYAVCHGSGHASRRHAFTYCLVVPTWCSYKKLAVDVRPGSQILCADGSIVLEVLTTDPPAGTVRARCLNTAMLGWVSWGLGAWKGYATSWGRIRGILRSLRWINFLH